MKVNEKEDGMDTLTERQEKALKYVYEEFAADTGEVAQHLGVTKETALKDLKGIAAGTLNAEEVTGYGTGMMTMGRGRRQLDGKYANLLWQCWDTYDNYTWEECLERAQARQRGEAV